MHCIEQSVLKFVLLHHPGQKSKWYEYIVEELKQTSSTIYETESMKDAISIYYQDEENSFMFYDFFLGSQRSSFELQELRGIKMYCIFSCKFELQRTMERVIGQRIKDICITGLSPVKCFSMCSFLSGFDPFISVASFLEGYLNARLSKSQANIRFELTNQFSQTAQTSYKYCVTTESECLCFMVLNDQPFQKQIKEEISGFLQDKLNLRQDPRNNEFFQKLIYICAISEIGNLALAGRCSFDLKPPMLTLPKQLHNVEQVEDIQSKVVSFCTTGNASINKEALFDPLKKLSFATFSSFYSSDKQKALDLYNKTINFSPSYFSNFQNLAQVFKGVAYIPSLPGVRKETEMLAFITQNSNNIVLAEKPAFANATSARRFLDRESNKYLELNQNQSRIFFGWHYLHHPANQEIIRRIQDGKEFGEITKITSSFTRPKPYSKNGRIFEPKQGGCGLDRFCYPLHLALTLAKKENIEQTFQIIDASTIMCNEIYGNDAPNLQQLEGKLESTLILNGSIEVKLMASMETQESFFSSASIIFENGTEIQIKWFVHPHIPYRDFGLYCASIKHSSEKAFSPLPIQSKFDTTMSSYDYQIQTLSQIKLGHLTYDTQKDMFNLCSKSNLYLASVLDAIFEKAGIPIKEGL